MNMFSRASFRSACAFVALVSFAEFANAQLGPPPVFNAFDANGVDLATGTFNHSVTDVVIGVPGAGGLAFTRNYNGGWRHNYFGGINRSGPSGTIYIVSIGTTSETFTLAGGSYVSDQGTGSTLTFNAGAQLYTYTSSRGDVGLFSKGLANPNGPYLANEGMIVSFASPSRETRVYHYNSVTVYVYQGGIGCIPGNNITARRLQSVTNNLGYQLHFGYATNSAATHLDLNSWNILNKVVGINNAIEYCAPLAFSCALTNTWPKIDFVGAITTATDSIGRVLTYTVNATQFRIRRPSSATDNVTVTLSSGRVSSVSNGSLTWSYAYVDTPTTRTTTVTDPSGHQRVVISNRLTGRVTSDRDALNRAVSYLYDSKSRLQRVTMPEGNYVQYTYDARGNVTEVRHVSKTPGTPADVVTSAAYSATCSNPVICNSPTASTDARGNVTAYTYDSTHGAVLSVTRPAVGGVAPQVRFGYTSLNAYYKNSSGSIVAGSPAVYRMTNRSACATTASCTNGADETRVVHDYGLAGAANNLLMVAATARAGDNSLSATTSTTYNFRGDLETIDGPLSGDLVRNRFDNARQLIGIIGPDPDGAGARPHAAIRFTYNLDGQVTLSERGTVQSQSDADWVAFSAASQTSTVFDAFGRAVSKSFGAGGATYSVIQQSFDGDGRPECTAVRMNPTTYGSLPGPCSLGATGAHGPDRITKKIYDAANQITKVVKAFGTPEASDEVTATYRNNGPIETVLDAEGNRTTYEYDGFDRLAKIRYPQAANGGISSTTDYEEYGFDSESNIVSIRQRDGSTIGVSFDALNRPSFRDVPGLTLDTTYSHDNFGRAIGIAFPSHSLAFSFDALGRTTQEFSPLGSVNYQYDSADRLTRMTWPGGGFYVDYEYDIGGALTAVRENSAVSGPGVLATFGYDNFGRQTSTARGNGTTSQYAYDAVSRLTALSHDLSGSSADQSFSFTYNPASQITIRTASNDSYAWLGHFNVDRAESINDLNQIASVGFAHDGRGNLTSDNSTTFTYNVDNQLVATSSGATLSYDPLGRLYQATNGSTTSFLYAGSSLIAEFNGSAVIRRYVHGQRVDEPITRYEGSGTSDRRWLMTDERGSIIADANGLGVATTINTYDEYGLPGLANSGRLQFTGQMWLHEAGIHHYKARAYSPSLGRFLQSDPIGYGDGMNMYAYVGGDPVNLTDPTGLNTYHLEFSCKQFDTGEKVCGWHLVREDGPPTQSGQWWEPRAGAGQPGVADFFSNSPREIANSYGDNSWSLAMWNVFVSSWVDSANDVAKGEYGSAALAASMALVKPAKLLKRVAEPLVKNPAAKRAVEAAKDATGKVHGKLPERSQLGEFDPEELRQLRGDLAESVQERIRKTQSLEPILGTLLGKRKSSNLSLPSTNFWAGRNFAEGK
jgi:RHS repeat-associated protein